MNGESLIPLSSATDEITASSRGGVIEHKGERIALDQNYWDGTANDGQGGPNVGALAKAVTDLRRQVSGRSDPPPDRYELTVPEALTETIEADPSHPLAKPAMEWAKKNGLSQAAFNDLTGLFYGHQAAQAGDEEKYYQEQNAILDQALGPRAETIKQDLVNWFEGLLAQDFRDQPELFEAAHLVTRDADGVLLLKALKNKISQRNVPSGRHEDLGVLMSDDLRNLQASKAYLDQSHPNHKATVAKVREGYQRLYKD